VTTYHAAFNGRKCHAIGITYRIVTTVQGDTPEDARLALCDRFEHIMGLKLTEAELGPEIEVTQ